MVEEERHRRGEAAEEGHQPGERQLRIVRQRHRRIGEPSRKEHEAERQQLPRVREVEGRRHDDLRQPAGLCVAGSSRPSSVLAGLHEARQHDEQVAGDARGDERVARLAEHIPGSNRRERGDQAREHPQTDQQGHRDVGHQVDLQTAQLLQAQGAGRVGGDRKQSIRRQAGHEAGRRRDRVFRDLQDVEQPLPAFDADQRDAQEQRRRAPPPAPRCSPAN